MRDWVLIQPDLSRTTVKFLGGSLNRFRDTCIPVPSFSNVTAMELHQALRASYKICRSREHITIKGDLTVIIPSVKHVLAAAESANFGKVTVHEVSVPRLTSNHINKCKSNRNHQWRQ